MLFAQILIQGIFKMIHVPHSILIIDDDIRFCTTMGKLLLLEGYKIFKALDIRSGLEILKKETIDAVLLDVMLPDGNGATFAKFIKEEYPAIRVIVISGSTDLKDCIDAIKNGAIDFIAKAGNNNLIEQIQNDLHFESPANLDGLHTKEKSSAIPYRSDNIIGQSKEIRQVMELIAKVADINSPLLILGETGTGKELFTKAVHNNGYRKNDPFVAFNCSSFSGELLESELFGYKSGAFTGALKDKKGLLEEANNGTLFLDEIGELGKDIQAKLLRVLETGEFIKLGDTRVLKVNIRLISATNKDLGEEVKKGTFREDLFYRINLFTIQLPPLRVRKGDIKLLANYFANMFSIKLNKQFINMTKEFENHLEAHPWRGNIRELKNVIERAVILMENSTLSEEYLPYEILSHQIVPENNNGSIYALNNFERSHIQKVLINTNWDKPQAAKMLDISISTLYRKIEEFMLLPTEHKLN